MRDNGRVPEKEPDPDISGWLLTSASFVLVLFWILIILAMVKIVTA